MTRVVALCGFLGVGKTTTLQHVLTQCPDDVSVGVVANDVAKVNIDAQLVKSVAEDAQGKLVSVQLENGCACCTASDDLVESIESLVANREDGFDYIIVEASGVAEAGQLREVLSELPCDILRGQDSQPFVITVVDAYDFLDQCRSADMLRDRPDLVGDAATTDAKRSVVDLLMEQVEHADSVILNKIDRLEGAVTRLEKLQAIVSGLARDEAEVHTSEFGAIDLLDLVAANAGGSSKAHNHCHADEICKHGSHCAHHHEKCNEGCARDHKSKYGISSFVFSSSRAFHGPTLAKTVLQPIAALQRAEDVAFDRTFSRGGDDAEQKEVDRDQALAETADVENPFCGVVRAKGFIWIDRQPSIKLYWSLAGKSFAVTPAGTWADEGDESTDQRRQELVFVGIGLEAQRQRILDLLEAALVPVPAE
ncbi:COBW domain-containing protein DDB_G0274527 [Hondaea fermentalgiana]|uniref:COBW domain-containing protein DDB_G0274527 n=1 Tax=Hondaea fermentalgiana TaxID=2315210 RepID=A0A2R5GM99_9STRA|nr:COBW domain-containing protein DDB_G0274527 [Hondaea fermentalgiana]|eukprot:GBG29421.1 COBW domain-containing protein DDB_G0274527 [Hondaea fermentalgiana]